MEIPTIPWNTVHHANANEMARITTLATGKYGLELRALLEQVGHALADLTTSLAPEGTVLVVAGRGQSGGAGFAAACLLATQGRSVWVVPTHEAENYSGVPKEQLERLCEFKRIRMRNSVPKMKFGCAIDAAIGTGLEGPPRGRTLDVITVLNNMTSTVIALDAPTGMSVDDGSTPGDAVQATATLSVILPKRGVAPGGRVGKLYLSSLSLPAELFASLGISAPPTDPALTQLVE